MTDATLHVLLDIFETDLGMEVPQADPTEILIGDLGFDSVAAAIGIVAIDERLGVRLTEQELVSCWTIADIVQLIDAGLPSENAAPDPRPE
ncbi:phosphopantetheine-binding protein [Nocardia altamirensis]|uniref:phosphopantetheine-binding protein n=1 Tax=Nocardia altamirensis TaxID=472158 RepID=UPI00083FF024|nr:phosphopantetheine-binding protein [Nocardia altamirensis]